MQAYLYALLGEINTLTPAGRARYHPAGAPPREGDVVTDPELADALDRFGADGPAPFYTGDVAAAVVEWVRAEGGALASADLAAYRVLRRDPLRTAYRDASVYTNPPPSAGGILIGRALAELDRLPGPPDVTALVAAMAVPSRSALRSSSASSPTPRTWPPSPWNWPARTGSAPPRTPRCSTPRAGPAR